MWFNLTSRNMRYVLGLVVAARATLAALMPFAGDFINWTNLGLAVLSGRRYLGIYTGPSYIFAAAFELWLLAGGDVTASHRLAQLYYGHGPSIIGPYLSTDLFAFAFVMKLPLLLADLATMLLVIHIVNDLTKSAAKAMLAAFLWASSPLVFLLEMFNATDVFAGLLILVGVYLVYKERIKAASLSFALCMFVRLSPALFLWVYLVAFARMRMRKQLSEFLAVQGMFLVLGATFIVATSGVGSVLNFVADDAPCRNIIGRSSGDRSIHRRSGIIQSLRAWLKHDGVHPRLIFRYET